MDETTSTIIERITIKSDKPMRLPNGEHSSVFYDCIQLTPNDLARLAAEAVGALSEDSFDLAVGIAYSGILFAAAIAGGRQVAILDHLGKIQGPNISAKRIVVVDDVIHLGKRLESFVNLLTAAGATVVGAACIVDRQSSDRGMLNLPIWSAFQVNAEDLHVEQ